MSRATSSASEPGGGRRRRRAATFFGVMVATVLISLGVLPLVSLLISQSRQTRESRDRVFAVHLAHNIVERFRAEPLGQVRYALDSLEAGEAFVRGDALLTPPDAPAAWRQHLERFRRVAVFTPTTERAGILEAIVSWNEEGRPREVRVATVLVDAEFPGGRP